MFVRHRTNPIAHRHEWGSVRCEHRDAGRPDATSNVTGSTNEETRQKLIRVERHPLGPRVYVFGRRVHEFAAGLVLVATIVSLHLAHVALPWHAGFALGAVGVWMVVKDGRDMFPRWRNTAAWSAGIHRRPLALRADRRGDWLPRVLAGLVAISALANVASALTPAEPDRVRTLAKLGYGDIIPHAALLALPTAGLLLLTAVSLVRRRHAALVASVVVLGILGLLNVFKGLDLEEAALSWAIAGVLVWGRRAFYVETSPHDVRLALRRLPWIFGGALAVMLVVIAFVATTRNPDVTLMLAFREVVGFGDPAGPSPYGELRALSLVAGAVGALAVVFATAPMLRPPGISRRPSPSAMRSRVRRIVTEHGSDTLSYFTLRSDVRHFFSANAAAVCAYRVQGRVLVVAGDPVGPDDAIAELMKDLALFAEARGLRIAMLGVGERFRATYRDVGLRAIYIGDEAVVETATFSLEGRPIRKVRQSVTRLGAAGYRCDVVTLGAMSAEMVAQMDAISHTWRAGADERGFSMAMDRICPIDSPESLVAIARDTDGLIRGFLHFVPCGPRAAVSLSAMRRDRSTPNGLTEFLVAESIGQLRARGIAEVSLNFASFARFIRSPRNMAERALGWLVCVANRHFQTESLYRFNAKFFPDWRPRYLMFEGVTSLPSAGIAALRVEGQIPQSFVPWRRTALGGTPDTPNEAILTSR